MLISYVCFPKIVVLLDSNVAKKICLVLLSNNLSSKSYGWRDAQLPSPLRQMCSWSIRRCNREGVAGIDQDKNIYLNYWFLNNPHMQKSRCMCLSFDITGDLKMAPKLAETDGIILLKLELKMQRTTQTRRIVYCRRNAKECIVLQTE